jgi:hypothetical protein
MTPPPVGDAELAFTLIALALGAALVEVLVGSAQAGWDRFQLLCFERGVGDTDRAALAAWARRAELADPAQVLLDRALFDRFVRDRVADIAVLEPPGSEGRRAAVAALGRLRGTLRHLPVRSPGAPVSSHDVIEGLRVSVRPDPLAGGTSPPARLAVVSVDEEGIVVAPLADDPPERAFHEAARTGRGVWVTFARSGEALHRFRSRVLDRPGVAPPALVLSHGEFLVREKRRRTPRVAFRVRARVLSVDGDPSRAFEAETLDVSLGGLAILAPAPLPRGARLAVEIALETGKVPVPVTIKVVGSGVREIDGVPRAFLSGPFAELSSDVRSQLASVVNARRAAPVAQANTLPLGSPVPA